MPIGNNIELLDEQLLELNNFLVEMIVEMKVEIYMKHLIVLDLEY